MAKKIIIPLVCLVILFFLDTLGIFSGMNYYFYDLAIRIRGSSTPLEKIVIIRIDEKTLDRLGRWPLRRSHYASFLKRVTEADLVAMDIILSEPSQDDVTLAKEIRKHGKVVLPVYIDEKMNVEYPSPALSSFRTGHVHIERGIDGIARDVYHTLYFAGTMLPSLSSVSFEMAAKRSFPRTDILPEQMDKTAILQVDYMSINYCGGPGSFAGISLVDVIDGLYPASFFRGKILLLGVTAMGLVDSAVTPFSGDRIGMPGVEIQANILNNLFLGNSIKTVPLQIRWLLCALFALSLYPLFFITSERSGIFWGIIIIFALSTGVYLLFVKWNTWLPPAIYYFTSIVLFVITYIFKLDDAVASLNETYRSILPHLRSKTTEDKGRGVRSGISGILTPRGIESQAIILSDITNQLVFEKELTDRILMSDIFGVAVFDPEGKMVIANRDVINICNDNSISLESRDLFIHGMIPYILEEIDKGAMFQQIEKHQGKSIFTVFIKKPEKRYLKTDLSLLPVEGRKFLLFIFSDITKIKEAEILKGQIVSIVSHELKAPMTSIQGFSEILNDNLEGQMHQFATIIHDESLRLSRFINTFLDINRLEEGKHPFIMVPVILSDVMEEAALALSPVAHKKGIKLRVEKPEKVVPVTADRDITMQCIINLTENAVKFSPPDREVVLRLDETVDIVRIDVIDQGYGIKTEDLDKIFEKFYRSPMEETENVKGSGLGLTFVKEAMEAQDGEISVQSTYGQGSTFSLLFPKN